MMDDIAGQKKAVSLLRADFESGRIAESYLFVGPRGVGKRTLTLEFAKLINCAHTETLPPAPPINNEIEDQIDLTLGSNLPIQEIFPSKESGPCNSCRKIDLGTHPDVFVLNFESQAKLLELDEDEAKKQKDFKIDAVRTLIQRSYLSPLEAKKKIFIIDGAEYLNMSSANALLKVLEESPKQCLWFLLAVNAERVIPTIRSRCRRISCAPLTPKEIEEILTRFGEHSADKIKEVSEICDGSLETASSLLSDDSTDLAKIADRLISPKQSFSPMQNALQISSLIVEEAKKGNARKRTEQFLKIFSLKMCSHMHIYPHPKNAERLASILQSQEELRRNVSPQLVLDSLLLSFSAGL